MVKMGKCTITPRHHILTEEGWMTARQAAARGQGLVIRSLIERVYNFCLVGGGNYYHQHLTPARSNDTHNGSNDGLPLYTDI